MKDRQSGCEAGGYRTVSFNLGSKKYKMQAHRILFCMYYGYWPKLVDHKDRNTHNNIKDNLRDVNKKLNCINSGMFSNNTSGYKGVSFHRGAWTAQIKNDQKKIHLGRFKNLEDAVNARLSAERIYWGEFG